MSVDRLTHGKFNTASPKTRRWTYCHPVCSSNGHTGRSRRRKRAQPGIRFREVCGAV